MIARVIGWCVEHRVLVLLMTCVMAVIAAFGVRDVRLDAIPDLSDVQVIVVTEYAGQNPQVVDDQVTLPLSSALLSVPGAKTVRGFSMYELSFVYVLFEDDTDLYWARSRVLETLSSTRGRLPRDVEPRLGPDATGVGWVYQYLLYPGWSCDAHARGIWRDEADGGEVAWYARRDDAPAERREHLTRVRGFEHEGRCPLDGRALLPSTHDLASLRSLHDWSLRNPLSSVDGVSEIAVFGGFVKQYQVLLDPLVLAAHGLDVLDVARALERSSDDVGGSVIELSENEYQVRSRGYVRGLADLEQVALGANEAGTPILLRDVATLAVGGEARRGVGELDGRGEAVGGIVIARSGENAWKVIQDVKRRLFELEDGLPQGVFVKETYDRSALIERAVATLSWSLTEELIVVALICLVFLAHARSALVAVLVLPLGLLASLLVMNQLGINANIMSLGGLALAIGVMVDSGIVMVENAHRRLELDERRADHDPSRRARIRIIVAAAQEVGPSLFFSLLVITVSFLPIFALGGESGRLFEPLAWTKTLAITAGALLGITIVPVLMVFLIKGRIPREERNPLNRLLVRAYEPAFRFVLRRPFATLAVTLLLGASALWPASRLGSEFMPPLDEGDLLYMPTTEPSLPIGKARELLQQTDKLIASFPEVKSVHGKIGRAETATDPAPLSMLETVVQLETDRSLWRTRTLERFHSDWPTWLAWPFEHTFFASTRPITTEELVYGWHDRDGATHVGLNGACSFPGMANSWTHPIETRLAMLSTGIKTPVGIKIHGPDLATLDRLAQLTAESVRVLPGTASAYAEPIFGGHALDIDIDRAALAQHALTLGDVQDVIAIAIGGMDVATTVQGVERYAIHVRYLRELRDDPEQIARTRIETPSGAHVPLAELATISIRPAAPMVRSEDGQHTAWIFVDVTADDLPAWVEHARAHVANALVLPEGYTCTWSGRFEELAAAEKRLTVVLPLTFALIIGLLYVSNRSWFKVGIILLAVPFSLIGALWFLYALDFSMSVAVWVGIIALLGVDAETGQMMLLYLDQSYESARAEGRLQTHTDLRLAIHEGAVQRIRPKAMTVATDMIGLMPLLWATGTGAEVTQRLVAPLIGGIAVSFAMELLVYPVIFYLVKRRGLRAE